MTRKAEWEENDTDDKISAHRTIPVMDIRRISEVRILRSQSSGTGLPAPEARQRQCFGPWHWVSSLDSHGKAQRGWACVRPSVPIRPRAYFVRSSNAMYT